MLDSNKSEESSFKKIVPYVRVLLTALLLFIYVGANFEKFVICITSLHRDSFQTEKSVHVLETLVGLAIMLFLLIFVGVYQIKQGIKEFKEIVDSNRVKFRMTSLITVFIISCLGTIFLYSSVFYTLNGNDSFTIIIITSLLISMSGFLVSIVDFKLWRKGRKKKNQ